MNIIFPSRHGDATREFAFLTRALGINMHVPVDTCLVLPSGHKKDELISLANGYGLSPVFDDQFTKRLLDEGCPVIIPTTRQYAEFEALNCKSKVMFRCSNGSANTIKTLKGLGCKNFICKNKRIAGLLGFNTFIARPLIASLHDTVLLPASSRSGFCSFVHHFAKYWPKSYRKFSDIARGSPGVRIENFGIGAANGVVEDSTYMTKAKAVIHLRDHGMTDYAVLKAIGFGIPIITDAETIRACYLEDYVIDGVTGKIASSIAGIVKIIADLNSNDKALDDLSLSCRDFAARSMTYTNEHGHCFKSYLENLQ
jgi:hypothetical protein